MTVFSQSGCETIEWKEFNGFEQSLTRNSPALAFDNNGKFYIAMGQNNISLWHQACDCDGEYKKIFNKENIRAFYVDMVINTVYTFYTNDYDNKLRF